MWFVNARFPDGSVAERQRYDFNYDTGCYDATSNFNWPETPPEFAYDSDDSATTYMSKMPHTVPGSYYA